MCPPGEREVSPNWFSPRPNWIGRGLPNDQTSQNFARANDPRESFEGTRRVATRPAKIGHLPPQSPFSGRAMRVKPDCCEPGRTFSPIQGAMQGRLCTRTTPEFVLPPHVFQVLLLERMRLTLRVTEASCSKYFAPLDPISTEPFGRLKKRDTPVERMLARVFRESSARLRFNACPRDVNVEVSATDDGRIAASAQDSPCFGRS